MPNLRHLMPPPGPPSPDLMPNCPPNLVHARQVGDYRRPMTISWGFRTWPPHRSPLRLCFQEQSKVRQIRRQSVCGLFGMGCWASSGTRDGGQIRKTRKQFRTFRIPSPLRHPRYSKVRKTRRRSVFSLLGLCIVPGCWAPSGVERGQIIKTPKTSVFGLFGRGQAGDHKLRGTGGRPRETTSWGHKLGAQAGGTSTNGGQAQRSKQEAQAGGTSGRPRETTN